MRPSAVVRWHCSGSGHGYIASHSAQMWLCGIFGIACLPLNHSRLPQEIKNRCGSTFIWRGIVALLKLFVKLVGLILCLCHRLVNGLGNRFNI